MKRADNKDIARLMFASMTRPFNAAMAGAGTLFAVAGMSNPLLGAVGAAMLVGTLGSVGRDLNNKEFLEEVLTPPEEMKQLDEPPGNVTGQYRMHCLDAKRHMDRTIEIINSAGPELADEMAPAREQIAEMVESVYRLAERAQRIDTSLASSNRADITKDIEKINAKLVVTADPETRWNLESTRQQKEERLKTYDELAITVKRIQAKIEYINAALDNVQLKVMKIGSVDLKTGAGHTDEVTQSLQNLLAEVGSFEKSLDSASGPLRSPDGSLESWDERAEQRNRLAAPPAESQLPPGPGGLPPAPQA